MIGIDISDSITLDPARLAQYTPPMTVPAAYDRLVTMTPGDYINVEAGARHQMGAHADGKGWRFTLRDGVKFASGTPMTVEDVKWSLDRVINLKDQPSQYIAHIDGVEIVDTKTVDIVLKKPARAAAHHHRRAGLRVLERKVVEQHGGTAGAGRQGRRTRPRPG